MILMHQLKYLQMLHHLPVWLQNTTNDWRPVTFALRSMTEVECCYAQIEKEALAATWACEKFTNYILGVKFTIEMDHKPLVLFWVQYDFIFSHPEHSISSYD